MNDFKIEPDRNTQRNWQDDFFVIWVEDFERLLPLIKKVRFIFDPVSDRRLKIWIRSEVIGEVCRDMRLNEICFFDSDEWVNRGF